MLFGQTEVDNEDFLVLLAQHEVGGLDVSVNKAALVHFLDRSEHFDQNLNGDFEVVVLLKATTSFGEVDSEQVHHDEILLRVGHEVVHVGHVLKTYDVRGKTYP